MAEGVSFLLLLFVCMPLKYIWNYGMPNKIVGMLHGILFIVYVTYVFLARAEFKWNARVTMIALLASVVPFGTFYADEKIFKKM